MLILFGAKILNRISLISNDLTFMFNEISRSFKSFQKVSTFVQKKKICSAVSNPFPRKKVEKLNGVIRVFSVNCGLQGFFLRFTALLTETMDCFVFTRWLQSPLIITVTHLNLRISFVSVLVFKYIKIVYCNYQKI